MASVHPGACAQLTAQQTLLRNQHAGEGEGLLVVALEPLVHHLQTGPTPKALEGSRPGEVGARPTAVGPTSQMPLVQGAVTSTDAAWPHVRDGILTCKNLALSPSPRSNTFCLWHLELLSGPHRTAVCPRQVTLDPSDGSTL